MIRMYIQVLMGPVVRVVPTIALILAQKGQTGVEVTNCFLETILVSFNTTRKTRTRQLTSTNDIVHKPMIVKPLTLLDQRQLLTKCNLCPDPFTFSSPKSSFIKGTSVNTSLSRDRSREYMR